MNDPDESAPLPNIARGGVVPHWRWWALAPLALACAAMASPYLATHGFLAISLALERGFALVCHQRPERSFWIFGGSVAVCSRCLGIYLGAALGLVFRTSRPVALRLLIAATALNLLDAASELAGLHRNWLGVRFAFGFALGAIGALLISSSASEDADRRVPSLKGLGIFALSPALTRWAKFVSPFGLYFFPMPTVWRLQWNGTQSPNPFTPRKQPSRRQSWPRLFR